MTRRLAFPAALCAPSAASAQDPGAAMVALARDLDPGLSALVAGVCWLLAFLAFGQGLLRLLKTSEDKFHAPSLAGTALCFLICAVLAAFPSWIAAAGETLFGPAPPAAAALAWAGAQGGAWNELVLAVFWAVSWIGLFAFLRGVFLLRAAADGRAGATAGRAAMHMLGGVLAWHMAAFVDAVQSTLGIRVLQ